MARCGWSTTHRHPSRVKQYEFSLLDETFVFPAKQAIADDKPCSPDELEYEPESYLQPGEAAVPEEVLMEDGSSSPWTPRWYLPCPARGSPAAGVVVFKAPPLPLHAAAKSGHTRSCSARSAAAWLSWPSRSGAGGVTRQPPLCAPSREPRRERCRFVSGPAWSLCLLPAGPHSCPTQPCRPLLPPSPSGQGHSAMPTVRSRPWVSFLQMQVRRPSPLAGCLPASCTSHSRWPPGYKWLVCLPCPAAPLKQGFRGGQTKAMEKRRAKKKKKKKILLHLPRDLLITILITCRMGRQFQLGFNGMVFVW